MLNPMQEQLGKSYFISLVAWLLQLQLEVAQTGLGYFASIIKVVFFVFLVLFCFLVLKKS